MRLAAVARAAFPALRNGREGTREQTNSVRDGRPRPKVVDQRHISAASAL